MRKISICLVFLMPLLIHAQSSFSRYIVQLRDKKGTHYTFGNPTAYLSAGAIQRRTRQHIVLDSTDLPITPAYLESIGSVPYVTILNRSKWMNQVLIKITDPRALAIINSFSFVQKTAPIAARVGKRHADTVYSNHAGVLGSIRGLAGVRDLVGAGGDLVSYGSSYAQIHIHRGEYLHNLGFRGEGITIAIIDDGFNGYLSNPAFDSVRSNRQVLGSWDFVNGKQSVNEEDVHGMYCFSIIAANRSGLLVGSAPKAKFWLFKTEDLRSEYPVEEQNWAAAAEFADSAGADLISSSLGYINFDDPSMNHAYAQRNGHEAISTRAVNFAVSKGMIVTAAAGNSGMATDDTKYVGCPGDADSALTVGATDAGGQIAAFSSWGPNSSGRIKPDVVSLGQGAFIASKDGNPASGNGTSFSNPNLAGLVACLWQAFPEFTNYEILDAVRKSSSGYRTPDERYGYGIPDFQKAYELLQTARSITTISNTGTQWIIAFPVPYTNDFTVVFKGQNEGTACLTLIDVMGRMIEKKAVVTGVGQWYSIHFDCSSRLPAGVYFVHYTDDKIKTTLRVIRK